MLRSVLKGLDKRRLRSVLMMFFVALAVPTGVLIYQAWSQLKWEAFYQHRVLAEELATRIDDRLVTLIAREEARSFGDYAFLVLSGDPAANFLQLSPLSGYPVDGEIPGLIAWFQVDARGALSTPLVPGAGVAAREYGIADGELAERVALEREVSRILADNRLVEKGPAERVATDNENDGILRLEISSGAGSPAPDSLAPEATFEASPARAAAPNVAPSPTSSRILSEIRSSEPARADVASQAAFDKLNAPSDAETAEVARSVESKLGRVADLKLEDAYAGRQR
ncbi:MAG: histidine kinase, partial [Gammaproteobacteria bacterium]